MSLALLLALQAISARAEAPAVPAELRSLVQQLRELRRTNEEALLARSARDEELRSLGDALENLRGDNGGDRNAVEPIKRRLNHLLLEQAARPDVRPPSPYGNVSPAELAAILREPGAGECRVSRGPRKNEYIFEREGRKVKIYFASNRLQASLAYSPDSSGEAIYVLQRDLVDEDSDKGPISYARIRFGLRSGRVEGLEVGGPIVPANEKEAMEMAIGFEPRALRLDCFR